MKRYPILDTSNYYTTYFIDDKKRPTVFISAGGGYAYTSPRESEPVAEVFQALGYHVVVVNYRETKEDSYPLPSIYLAYALKQIQQSPFVSCLIGLGFSAGGHNLLEVCFHKEEYSLDKTVDLLMLGYPVVTTDQRYWHKGSFDNLLKEKIEDYSILKHLSMELEVPDFAPDLFLWGTFTDESVSVMNSILLLEAYKKKNRNAEYHMFYKGGHGYSVCNEKSADGNPDKVSPYIGRWVDMADKWIKDKLKNRL